MPDGDWVYIPTASPDGLYVVQAPVAGDPDNVRVLPTQVIMAGTAAVRPAAGAAYNGCLYLETDTAGGTLFRCDGTAWIQTALGVLPNQLKVAQDLHVQGDISPAQITADQNDYNPTGLATAAVLRLSSDAARNVTGLAGGADGRVLVLHDIGSNRIVLKDESASSTAANRFALNADLTLSADQSCVLWYDATSSRWRLAAASTAPPHDHTATDGSGVLTNDEHDGYGEYAEISSPSSPAADKLRQYARDVGGVTHLATSGRRGWRRSSLA